MIRRSGAFRHAHGRSDLRHTLIPLRSRPVRRYQGAACRNVPTGPHPVGRCGTPMLRSEAASGGDGSCAVV